MVDFERLLEWFDREARDLPWRHTDDPYRIWVSEIMLQQTQVKTVIDYYHRFLEEYPAVEDLAAATQDEVLKLWEGLGYYSRARWLHRAGKTLVEEFDGEMPESESARKQLTGIGDYTAAAIGAFAFNQASPVMDGNVKRVIARFRGINNPVDRTDTEARIRDFLTGWLDSTNRPGTLSEAVMELGALVCVPSSPDCEHCPLNPGCEAYETDRQDELPVTAPRPERPHYEVTAGVVVDGDRILVSRRPEDGMLGGLWEFPGGKLEEGETLQQCLARELDEELGITVEVSDKLKEIPHGYSHMTINLHAYRCHIIEGKPSSREGQQWQWILPDQIDELAFPKSNHPIVERVKAGVGAARKN